MNRLVSVYSDCLFAIGAIAVAATSTICASTISVAAFYIAFVLGFARCFYCHDLNFYL